MKSGLQISLFLLAVGLLRRTSAVMSNDDARATITKLLDSSAMKAVLTCSFNITGKSANLPSGSDTGSNLQSAAIDCSGGTLNLIGGPALQHFKDSFRGVNYTLEYELPEGTISIANQALNIINSNFKDLNPSGPACLLLSNVNATIQTSTFSGNSQADAGALEAVDGSNLIILNSTFSNNVGLNAGAVALRNSSIFVNGSTFSYNKGPQGGGIYFMNGTTYAIYVANSAFMHNTASSGGALYAQYCDHAIYYNNMFVNNSATGNGGSIFQVNCGGALVLNAVSKGSALSGGGAYINDVGSIGLYQNEWTSNSARTGSGAVNFQSVHEGAIANETFFKNLGEQGGAYFGKSTNCNLTSCTFKENKASKNGGAVFRSVTSGGTVSCLFENNTAAEMGGAIFDTEVAGGLADNVFKGNKAGKSKTSALHRMKSYNKIDNNQGLQLNSNFQNSEPNWSSKPV